MLSDPAPEPLNPPVAELETQPLHFLSLICRSFSLESLVSLLGCSLQFPNFVTPDH